MTALMEGDPVTLFVNRPWIDYKCSKCPKKTRQREGVIVGHNNCPGMKNSNSRLPALPIFKPIT